MRTFWFSEFTLKYILHVNVREFREMLQNVQTWTSKVLCDNSEKCSRRSVALACSHVENVTLWSFFERHQADSAAANPLLDDAQQTFIIDLGAVERVSEFDARKSA